MNATNPRKSPILSSQLKKAREILQFSIAEVAESIVVGQQEIMNWEKGVKHPSVKQLEALASLYGREIDYFLKDSPAVAPEIEFRGKPRQSLRSLPKEARVVIARFEELCRTTLELDELLGKKRVMTIPRFKSSDHPDIVAKSVRSLLGADGKPIPRLRYALENLGFLVFELPVPEGGFSGLSFWYSDDVPAILVNAGDPSGRRNFTLAHELAHLVYEHGSCMCYIPLDFTPDASDVEGKANRVAVELLMPREGITEDFRRRSLSPTPSALELGKMGGRWGVSVQALGYRLERLGLIQKEHTNQLPETKPYFPRVKTPRWERQLGKQFVQTAMEAYNKGLITSGKLSRALGITVRKTLEEVARRSG
jgi:Zn-dependent peptidase ImmA (M78 family)/transcriptional regulator with XRE-family HTH domain